MHRFLAFSAGKHEIANELLALDRSNPMFNENRSRVLAAGRPLLAAAHRSGDAAYVEPILSAALDGLRDPV